MKVFVKTLKGMQFEIEVTLQDTVADVKKNIETVQGGPDVYPAAKLMIFHKGKVLKDDSTMEENEVSENSSIYIMLSKPKRSSVPSPPTSPPPRVAAPAPPPLAPASPPTESTDIVYQTHPNEIRNLAGIILRVVENSGGRWNRDTILYAAEYLSSGRLPPATPGPNTDPLNLFPEDNPPPPRQRLANFLIDLPAYQEVREKLKAYPHNSQPALEEVQRENPQREGVVQYEDTLLNMIFEGGEDTWGQVAPGSQITQPLTDDDNAALDRLAAMGYSRTLVLGVYLSFGKNEQLTADYLMDHWNPEGIDRPEANEFD